ncbi:MAG TPA: DUF2934 domain-containing protein [Alloacidobacterium sp.]|nr:DUF2934 domain-containing protein [Alloacidobacterium sp.]
MATPKAEKTAKPRKTPAKKKAAVEVVAEPTFIRPTHEQIAALAQKFWAERGYTDGHAEQDWLRAEQELMKIAS